MASFVFAMETHDDRRVHQRLAVPQVLVKISTPERMRVAYLKDLSKGGLFIKTDRPLALDRLIDVDLLPPGRTTPIRVRCKVMRVLDDEQAKKTQSQGMGLKFVDVDPVIMSALDALLEEYQGKPATPATPTAPDASTVQLKQALEEVAALTDALADRDRELAQARQRREEIESRVRSGAESGSAASDELQRELETARTELGDLQTRLSEALGDAEAYRHELAVMEGDDASSRRLAETLAQQKAELETALNERLAEAELQRGALEESTAQRLADAELQRTELETTLNQRLAEAELHRTGLEAALLEAEQQRVAIEAALTEAQQHRVWFEGALAEAEQQRATLEAALAEAQQQKAGLDGALSERMAEAELQRMELEGALNQRLASLEAALSDAQTEAAVQRGELEASMADRLEQAEQQRAALEAALSDAQTEAAVQRGELEAGMADRLAQSEQQRAALEAALSDAQTEAAVQRGELEASLSDRLTGADQELDAERSRRFEAERREADVAGAQVQLSARNAELEALLLAAREELDSAVETTTQLEAARARIAALERGAKPVPAAKPPAAARQAPKPAVAPPPPAGAATTPEIENFLRRLRANEPLFRLAAFHDYTPADPHEGEMMGLLEGCDTYSDLVALGRSLATPMQLEKMLIGLHQRTLIAFERPS